MPYLYSLGVEGVQARAGGTAMIWGQHEIDCYAQAVPQRLCNRRRQACGRSRGRATSLADSKKRRSAVSHRFYLSDEQFLLHGIKRLKSSQNIKLLQEIIAVTG